LELEDWHVRWSYIGHKRVSVCIFGPPNHPSLEKRIVIVGIGKEYKTEEEYEEGKKTHKLMFSSFSSIETRIQECVCFCGMNE